MRAKAIIDKYEDLSDEIKTFFQEDFIDVTLDREYNIYALSSWENHFFFLIRSDSDFPAWPHSSIFSVTDSGIPDDWICTIRSGQVKMILGPEFVADDIEAYNSMVELETEAVKSFWERVESDKVERIYHVLTNWNPIGISGAITEEEYREYVGKFHSVGKNLAKLEAGLTDLILETLGIEYGGDNPVHRRDVERVALELMQAFDA